jgi:PAS domain S-box-containing protein
MSSQTKTEKLDAGPDPALTARYVALLQAYVESSDEAVLVAAHEYGRELLAREWGVLEVVSMHSRSVWNAVGRDGAPDRAPGLVAAERLLLEVLVPFEMAHRALRTANAALQESEDRYDRLLGAANDIVFTTDLSGRLISINRAGELVSGYTRAELLALGLPTLLPELSVQSASDFLLGQAKPREVQLVTKDGRRRLLELATAPVQERGGTVGVQGIARDITDRRNAEVALRHVNDHLEDKAKRIAHALHDEAGQLLATVYLRVAEIAGELPPLGRRRMEELRALLDQVDDQLRRLAYELRPTILDDLGLVPACQFLAEGISRRTRVRVLVRGSTGGRLPPDIETALYRVAQEALGNVGKHARARTATVEFERAVGCLRGTIRDDGVGFDVQGVLSRVGPQGLGLMGMRERVAAVGGHFEVRSVTGGGTSVSFEVPLAPSEGG